MEKSDIIRIGDIVKIVNPLIVTKVGYEFTHKDACQVVEKEHKESVWKLMRELNVVNNKIVEKKIISALAFGLVRKNVKSGNERKIHTELREELRMEEATIVGKKTAVTGIYFPPVSGTAPFYDEYEPGGLRNPKTHIILELSFAGKLQYNAETLIERCNVELVLSKHII